MLPYFSCELIYGLLNLLLIYKKLLEQIESNIIIISYCEKLLMD